MNRAFALGLLLLLLGAAPAAAGPLTEIGRIGKPELIYEASEVYAGLTTQVSDVGDRYEIEEAEDSIEPNDTSNCRVSSDKTIASCRRSVRQGGRSYPLYRITVTGGAKLANDIVFRRTSIRGILFGGSFDDRLIGGRNSDRIYGKSRSDVVDGQGGRDHLYGGRGHDTIRARDGVADRVLCGPGTDTVSADRADELVDCERVER